MPLTESQIQNEPCQRTITEEWSWGTKDRKLIENHIKDIIAEIRRKLRGEDKTEFNYDGSDYAGGGDGTLDCLGCHKRFRLTVERFCPNRKNEQTPYGTTAKHTDMERLQWGFAYMCSGQRSKTMIPKSMLNVMWDTTAILAASETRLLATWTLVDFPH